MNISGKARLIFSAVSTFFIVSCGGGSSENGSLDESTDVNLKPVALFTAVVEQNELVLDASDSFDPDDDQLSYSWKVGSDIQLYDVAHRVAYDATKEYRIELTVSDGIDADVEVQTLSADGALITPLEPGDPILGQSRYEDSANQCTNCHGRDGQAGIIIDPEKATYEHSGEPGVQYSLADYLVKWMPPGSESVCDGQCAEDIAAYIRTWGSFEEPLPTPTPVAQDPTPSPVVVTPEPSPDPAISPEPTASPDPVVIGDISNGQLLYDSGTLSCKTCHGDDEASPIAASIPAIDPSKATFTHSSAPDQVYNLEDYIVKWMPPSDVTLCDDACATDIAAYIQSWGGQPAPTPTPIVASPVPSPSPVGSPEPSPVVEPTPVATPEVTPSPVASPTPSISPTPEVEPELVYAINAGGESYTATDGTAYRADEYADGGSDDIADEQSIANTEDDVLYRSERYGNFSYELPLETGTYQVVLQFAEIYWPRAAARVFDVAIEGQTVVDNLDIYAEVGSNFAAYDVVIDSVAVTDGAMDIEFTTVTDNAKISAFRIYQIDGEAVVSPTPEPTVSPTPSPEVSPTPDPELGDAEQGEILYVSAEQGCAQCHGDDGVSPSPFFPDIDPNQATFSHSSEPDVDLDLATYLERWMPQGEPEDCGEQCSRDIAAYIRSWVAQPTPTPDAEPSPTPTPVVDEPSPTPTPDADPTPTPDADPSPTPTPDAEPTPDPGVGDPISGESLYTQGCQNCHGANGQSSLSRIPDIDPSKVTYVDASQPDVSLSLAQYISTYMPDGAEGTCDAQCGADIAAYILTWSNDDIVDVNCDIQGISYGRRQMRLLTSAEYENTLEDLLGFEVNAVNAGIPSDTIVESFANQSLTPVTQAYMDAYVSVAESAAEFAADNDFAGVVDCSGDSNSQCAEEFIAEFAPRAYRRPLTADEAERYRTLFDASLSEGSNDEGLKMAIRTALSSPFFLYRSEMGELVADIIDEINNGDPVLVPGTVAVQLDGDDISAGDSGYLSIALYQGADPGDFPGVRSYDFTGNDVVSIRARGVFADGAFPTLRLIVDNQPLGDQLVESDTDGTYTFAVSGVTGTNKYVRIENTNPEGTAHSESRNLEIASISLGDAVEVVRELPDENLDDDAYVLTAYEMATFLAYTYTGTTPDDTLMAAAAANALSTDEEIQAQILRLLGTEKSREHFGEFAAQWLHADQVLSATKSADLFPGFTADIRSAMATEVREIFKHVMFDDTQPITNIYDNFSFMNRDLAEFYGVSGPSGSTFEKVTDLANRGGVLTSGAFMAGFAHEEETSPIQRAVAVREDMLCQQVPPMPTNLELAREAADGALEAFIEEQGGAISNRVRYDFLTRDDICQVCHESIINPHGFGMEDFDAVGLLRAVDANNLDIDASGELRGTFELDDGDVVPFTGAHAFSSVIQSLPAAQECFTQKSFRFVMGIGHDAYDYVSDDAPELADDELSGYSCTLDSMSASMAQSNNNARSAVTALGVSDVVRFRKQR